MYLFVRRVMDRIKTKSPALFDLSPNSLCLYFFGGSLLLTIVLLLAAHYLAGAPYPYARVVLYCWPLLAFTMCLLIQRFRSGALPRRSFAALYLLFCGAMAVQSGLQFTLDHFGWMEYAAGTGQAASFLRERPAEAGQEVNIAVSGLLYASLDFYRAMYSMHHWRLAVYSGTDAASDYLVLDGIDAQIGIPHGFRRIWRDPLSKAVIAVPEDPTASNWGKGR